MSGTGTDHRPTEIRYLSAQRMLRLAFADGRSSELSAEFLRVHSPSAEVQGHTPSQAVLQVGKRDVAIVSIEPVGNYAVRLVFDDGHDSGIYSFEELQRLIQHRDQLWQHYLEKLQAAGASREK